jgi:hypothetical protein
MNKMMKGGKATKGYGKKMMGMMEAGEMMPAMPAKKGVAAKAVRKGTAMKKKMK